MDDGTPVADPTVPELLLLTVLVAIGFLLAVAFYRTLSTRDVLVKQTRGLARRISPRWWARGLIYIVTVGIGIPVLIVVWAIVLESALFVLVSPDALDTVSITAVAVVGAARVLAYANERVAGELAKALPMAFLFLLLTGGSADFDDKLASLDDRNPLALTDAMLGFLIALELGLRVLTESSHELLARIRRRWGVRSDAGVWRTGASALGLGGLEPGGEGRPAPQIDHTTPGRRR